MFAFLSPLQSHLLYDALFYLAFIVGQLLFVLKRAGSAIRNPTTTIKTRWEYVNLNWDTILIRGVLEFLVIFYPWRHFSTAEIAHFFGWNIGTWSLPDNPVVATLLGFASDSLLDWLAVSQKLPSFLQKWLSENVPQLPANQQGGRKP